MRDNYLFPSNKHSSIPQHAFLPLSLTLSACRYPFFTMSIKPTAFENAHQTFCFAFGRTCYIVEASFVAFQEGHFVSKQASLRKRSGPMRGQGGGA